MRVAGQHQEFWIIKNKILKIKTTPVYLKKKIVFKLFVCMHSKVGLFFNIFILYLYMIDYIIALTNKLYNDFHQNQTIYWSLYENYFNLL